MPLPTYLYHEKPTTWRDWFRARYFIASDRPLPYGHIEAAAFTRWGAERLLARVGGWAPVRRMELLTSNSTRRQL